MTALCWIKNERMWKQYVQHRVEEIWNLTSKDSWRHCPGELNPGDIPSCGLPAKELSGGMAQSFFTDQKQIDRVRRQGCHRRSCKESASHQVFSCKYFKRDARKDS